MEGPSTCVLADGVYAVLQSRLWRPAFTSRYSGGKLLLLLLANAQLTLHPELRVELITWRNAGNASFYNIFIDPHVPGPDDPRDFRETPDYLMEIDFHRFSISTGVLSGKVVRRSLKDDNVRKTEI